MSPFEQLKELQRKFDSEKKQLEELAKAAGYLKPRSIPPGLWKLTPSWKNRETLKSHLCHSFTEAKDELEKVIATKGEG